MCGGVVNNQIKKGLLLSLRVKKLKSVNIWQSYKQERDCLVHFFRLLAACWSGAQSARDNDARACNVAKYSRKPHADVGKFPRASNCNSICR